MTFFPKNEAPEVDCSVKPSVNLFINGWTYGPLEVSETWNGMVRVEGDGEFAILALGEGERTVFDMDVARVITASPNILKAIAKEKGEKT